MAQILGRGPGGRALCLAGVGDAGIQRQTGEGGVGRECLHPGMYQSATTRPIGNYPEAAGKCRLRWRSRLWQMRQLCSMPRPAAKAMRSASAKLVTPSFTMTLAR